MGEEEVTEEIREVSRKNFFVDVDTGILEHHKKMVDLIVWESPVDYGSYPATKFVAEAGKKYGDEWSESPWDDILGEEPLGSFNDLYRFLDKYHFLDILVVFFRGEFDYDSNGQILLDGSGNPTFVKRLAEIFRSTKHVDYAPTTFKVKVFQEDGTTPIEDADVTVEFGSVETDIEFVEEEGIYTGKVYGIGSANLVVEKEGFDTFILPVELVFNRTISQDRIRQENDYETRYLNIVLVAEEE